MAKLTGLFQPSQPPSLRGYAYVREWRGIQVVCKWPRKRGKNISQKQRERVEWFQEARELEKYIPAAQQSVAIEATKGTALYPGDLLMMAMSGRVFAIQKEDGTTVYSVAMVSDVSKNLDIIGQMPGDILARGPINWTRVAGGTVGQVLTSQGPDVPPAWEPSAGGGGSANYSPMQHGSTAGASTATQGYSFFPLENMEISGAVCTYDELSGADYVASVVEIVSNALGSVLAQSSAFTGTQNGLVRRSFSFASAAALSAGTEYALIFTRTDGADTYSLPMRFDSANEPQFPADLNYGNVRAATNDPSSGASVTRGSQNIMAVSPMYTI